MYVYMSVCVRVWDCTTVFNSVSVVGVPFESMALKRGGGDFTFQPVDAHDHLLGCAYTLQGCLGCRQVPD